MRQDDMSQEEGHEVETMDGLGHWFVRRPFFLESGRFLLSFTRHWARLCESRSLDPEGTGPSRLV